MTKQPIYAKWNGRLSRLLNGQRNDIAPMFQLSRPSFVDVSVDPLFVTKYSQMDANPDPTSSKAFPTLPIFEPE